MRRVAILGATGYSGCEVIEILLRHPKVEINYLASRTEEPKPISEFFPQLAGRLDLACEKLDADQAARRADVVFLALPHTAALEVVPRLLRAKKQVVDLSADYRLKDPRVYEEWYLVKHSSPALLKQAVYGLTELHRADVRKANLVANPGCYPTGALLGLAPLAQRGWIARDGLIIDAKSGTTGAGRSSAMQMTFSEVDENVNAYKVNAHQHMPEIEQELAGLAGRRVQVTFVPHLMPMKRGILSTMYIPLTQGLTSQQLVELYQARYRKERFIRVLPAGKTPHTKAVERTNCCEIGLVGDPAAKRAIVITAIDNLQKGAAGQAVQNMNVMAGFDETLGLV